MSVPNFFFNSFNLHLGKFSASIYYFQAIVAFGLIFLLVVTLAQVRRHYVDWSFKGAFFGVIVGFFLAIILEGFLIIYGKTAIIGLLGWKDAPKPLSAVLDISRAKLVDVLGVKTQSAESTDVIKTIQSMNPLEVRRLKSIICVP